MPDTTEHPEGFCLCSSWSKPFIQYKIVHVFIVDVWSKKLALLLNWTCTAFFTFFTVYSRTLLLKACSDILVSWAGKQQTAHAELTTGHKHLRLSLPMQGTKQRWRLLNITYLLTYKPLRPHFLWVKTSISLSFTFVSFVVCSTNCHNYLLDIQSSLVISRLLEMTQQYCTSIF